MVNLSNCFNWSCVQGCANFLLPSPFSACLGRSGLQLAVFGVGTKYAFTGFIRWLYRRGGQFLPGAVGAGVRFASQCRFRFLRWRGPVDGRASGFA
jgi:hypothetical protein